MGNFITDLIKTTKGKIGAIGRGEITAKDSGIGKLINKLKEVDEAAYEECLKLYKEALKK